MPSDSLRIDRVIRSGRRSIALVVTEEAELLVRAPWHVPGSVLEDLVRSRSSWIVTKKEEALRKKPVPRNFEEGESLPFLGREYPLAFSVHGGKGIELTDMITLPASVGCIREEIIAWYREKAKIIIPEICDHWSDLTGLNPLSVKITGARTRWGSCSSRGRLNFTWRLVMAPFDIVDYVVVHELVHLEIRNHSRSYWERVGSILPDYTDKRKWLKDHGRELVL